MLAVTVWFLAQQLFIVLSRYVIIDISTGVRNSCHRCSDFYMACTMNERHVYSRDQLLMGRRPLCRPTLPSDVKYKVCELGIRRRVRGTRAGRKVTRLQPRPIPVLCTTSRDRSNVCKHYEQLIPSSTSTLQVPLRSRRNLLRVPLVNDVPTNCSTVVTGWTAPTVYVLNAATPCSRSVSLQCRYCYYI